MHIKMALGAAFKYLVKLILQSVCSRLNLYLNGLASMISSYQCFRLGLCVCVDRQLHSMKCSLIYYLNLELLSDQSREQTLTICIGVVVVGDSSCWEEAQSKKVKKTGEKAYKMKAGDQRVILTILLLPAVGSSRLIT